MLHLASILSDPELVGASFSVHRAFYRLSEGEKELLREEIYETFGTVHPARMEEIQLLPVEYRSSPILLIHSPVQLSTGRRLDDTTFTAPDRILYNFQTWLVISVRDWTPFGFCRAYAVLQKET